MSMDEDVVFYLRDTARVYSPRHVCSIVKRAELQGHPVEKGSYLEQMTISQIERLLESRYDA